MIDNKFVKEPVNFKNEFTSKAKSDPRPKKDSSSAIVDVEAEVKDIDWDLQTHFSHGMENAIEMLKQKKKSFLIFAHLIWT